jgi:hypothetical protein
MAPIITNGNFDAITAFSAIAVTAESDTDLFSAAAHGLLDGQEVRLYGLEGDDLTIDEGVFYIINKHADDFQLSDERGGSAVSIGGDITAGYVIRTENGIPTGWTITKAGSSEVIARIEPDLSPSDMPVGSFAEIRVDATPAAASLHEHITLVPLTRYRLSLECYWLHEDPAEIVPAHVAKLSLVEDGNGHSLLSTGLWQANQNAKIDLPVPKAKGGRLAIPFETPATHTAYTLTIDKGTMDGTTGYLEIMRISRVRIEPIAFDNPHTDRPENDDTVRAALPQNS